MGFRLSAPCVQHKTCWQSWANIVLGVWLIFTPWLTGFALYKHAAIANFWITGAAVVIFAVAALCTVQLWEQGINFALGVWIAMAPWLFHFKAIGTPMWNAVVTGGLICFCAAASMPGGEKIRGAISYELTPLESKRAPKKA